MWNIVQHLMHEVIDEKTTHHEATLCLQWLCFSSFFVVWKFLNLQVLRDVNCYIKQIVWRKKIRDSEVKPIK